jgi:hypothetical protein
MIIRGGGATGAAGFAGVAICISATFEAGWAAGGALPTGAGGVAAGNRGGTAIAGGAVLADADAVVVAAGAAGILGGITTTDGGRYVAATDAGVTILGAGGGAGAVGSTAGLVGPAFGTDTDDDGGGAVPTVAAASGLASSAEADIEACVDAGAEVAGLAGGRAVEGSTTPFCWVIALSTSPGREMCERSILVLISSSP